MPFVFSLHSRLEAELLGSLWGRQRRGSKSIEVCGCFTVRLNQPRHTTIANFERKPFADFPLCAVPGLLTCQLLTVHSPHSAHLVVGM